MGDTLNPFSELERPSVMDPTFDLDYYRRVVSQRHYRVRNYISLSYFSRPRSYSGETDNNNDIYVYIQKYKTFLCFIIVLYQNNNSLQTFLSRKIKCRNTCQVLKIVSVKILKIKFYSLLFNWLVVPP